MKQNFNILITGVGGQGLVTLVDVLTKAILADGKDVKSSELHGLSQRGGAVAIYVSMGKEAGPEQSQRVWSPLFKKGDTNLILGLDLLETLRGCEFANKQTKILANDYLLPLLRQGFEGQAFDNKENILLELQKIAKDNLKIVEASEICKEKLQKEVLATMYLLGYAVYNKFIDIKPESVVIGIKKAVPEKYQQMNIDAFNLAKNN